MFTRVTRRWHAEGGLGIGLALSKGLVELHGGRIEARSAGLGQGSEFSVIAAEVPGGRCAGKPPVCLEQRERPRRCAAYSGCR